MSPSPADGFPVVVAFDGSAPARAAIGAAVTLFGDRGLIVVTVWEPGLARVTQMQPDPMTYTYIVPSAEVVAAVDRRDQQHAEAVAEAGARLARELGATAEALAVADAGEVAEAICEIADQRAAVAVVVGSRGLAGVKARLFGSTSRRLLHESPRPVLVVRD
jgi:nucleotide-binding universal stress UspA family protein